MSELVPLYTVQVRRLGEDRRLNTNHLQRATLKPILLLFSRFQFQRSLFSGQDRRNKKPTSRSGAGNSIAFKTVRIRTDRTVTEGAHFFSFAFLSFHYKVPSFCYLDEIGSVKGLTLW